MRNLQRDIETFLIGLIVVILAIFASSYAHGALRTHSANVFNNPVSIGDSATAVTSSMLDIKSTTKGVLWPRMTSTQRAAISSPATGLLVWDSTLLEPCQYSGSAWQCFPPGSTSALGNLKVVETDSGGLLTGASSLGISLGGTGQTTANAALNALLPSQTGNANKVLQTDGSNTSWATASGGGGGLNFVGLNTSFVLGTSDDVGAENSTGNWATYADAAGTDPVDMTGGSATALTFSRTTTAGEVLDGSGSFKIVKAASNAQGMGVSVAVNIPPGYRGQNMQYTIPFHIISGSISSDDLKLESYDVTNSALLSVSCNTGSSTDANQVYTTSTVLVICNGVIPSSTAQIRIGFHFASTSTTAVTFSFDDVYVAPPSNVGTGAIVSDWSSDLTFTPNNFGTSPTTSLRYKRQGDTLWVNGTITPGSSIPASVASISLPSNLTIDSSKLSANSVEYLGSGHNTNQAAGSLSSNGMSLAYFYDGSDTAKVYVTYQTSNAPGYVKVNGSSVWATGDTFSVDFKVPISQWSSSGTTFNASQVGGSWTGTLAGTGGGWSTTSGTYADFTVATTSTTLTPLSAVNFGTVTAESTKLPGITFTPSAAATYHVCAGGSVYNTGGSAAYVELVDSNGNTINAGQRNTTVSSGVVPFSLCGTDNLTSISAITFKIKGAASASTTNILQDSLAPITWEIYPVSQSMPAPLLVNSVTSSSAGVERVERVSFAGDSGDSTACTSSPCVVSAQSGSWVTSVTRSSTGAYLINIPSNEFSAVPTCTVGHNPGIVGTAGECFYKRASSTTTSLTIACFNSAQSAGFDANAEVICMGPH
jgi:hypothetical protein